MMSILTSEGTCYHCHHILFPTQSSCYRGGEDCTFLILGKQGSLGAVLEADSPLTVLLLPLCSLYY